MDHSGHNSRRLIRSAAVLRRGDLPDVPTGAGKRVHHRRGVVFTGDEIRTGQDVWRSVWGQGAYTEPDWPAHWLHREAEWLVEHWATVDYGTRFELLHVDQAAGLQSRLRSELRANTYDLSSGTITVSPLRAQEIRAVQDHYMGLFGDDARLDELRESYAMPRSVIPDLDRREAFTSFIFWVSWACVTERPDEDITYTNNWPPDDLVGNRPTGTMIVVSVISFVLLLGGIGGLAWFYAASRDKWSSHGEAPAADPPSTSSRRRPWSPRASISG